MASRARLATRPIHFIRSSRDAEANHDANGRLAVAMVNLPEGRIKCNIGKAGCSAVQQEFGWIRGGFQ